MVDSPGALALIPGWSDANFLARPLAGHPLIAYSIAACLQAASIAKTVVLSQDDAVIRIAKAAGLQVLPITGSDNGFPLYGNIDFSQLIQAVIQNLPIQPEVVLWVDPLAPLRPRELISQASSQAASQPIGSLVQSVVPLNPNGEILWAIHKQQPMESVNGLGLLYTQTRHILAARLETFLSGAFNCFSPLVVEPTLSPDIRNSAGWQWSEWTIQYAREDIIYAGRTPRPLPEKTALLVLDFDGVLTDNRVWVDEEGHEQISAFRSDSLGLIYLRQAGVEVIVLSMETNPVVAARCRKMKIPVQQGINDKAAALSNMLQERHIDPANVVYLGNDLNDVSCFPLVGCAVVVADAEPGALRQADLVLQRRGGYGAVRELCDRLIEKIKR